MASDNQTINTLKDMHLRPMAEEYERQQKNPSMLELPFSHRFGLIVDYEKSIREQKKWRRMYKRANFKQHAYPEDVKYSAERGLNREEIEQLFMCDYIRRLQNILITGPAGTGKTWLASAFGHAALNQKYTVRNIRLARLFEDFKIAQGDGTIRKYRANLVKVNLLIIDDWALVPVTASVRHELLELIDDRMAAGSIIITSQLPVDQWHTYLGDATVADAILDRLVTCAYRIALKGDTLRSMDKTALLNQEVK